VETDWQAKGQVDGCNRAEQKEPFLDVSQDSSLGFGISILSTHISGGISIPRLTHYRSEAVLSLFEEVADTYHEVSISGLAVRGADNPMCLPKLFQQVNWPIWICFSTLRLVDLNLENNFRGISPYNSNRNLDLRSISHFELRRCRDNNFLQWLCKHGAHHFRPRKFIYVMREKQEPSPPDLRGVYNEEFEALMNVIIRITGYRNHLECLGVHLPPNILYQQAEDLLYALGTGSVLLRYRHLPEMRELVVIIEDHLLRQCHINRVARAGPKLRDPEEMGKISSWSRLYDDPVVGDEHWARMGTGPAQFWCTEDAGCRTYHGRSFAEA